MANAGPDSGNMISGLIARADDEISRVIVRIADSIAHRFRKSNADPNRDIPHSLAPASADAEIPPSVNLTDEEIIDRFVILAYEPMVRSTVIFGGCYVAFEWINKGYLLDLISMIQVLVLLSQYTFLFIFYLFLSYSDYLNVCFRLRRYAKHC